ncbi:hypothetical protein P8452_50067 [Trifolium repens]|nr:hypothetical protein P8452_50067 [Trifolium repens]
MFIPDEADVSFIYHVQGFGYDRVIDDYKVIRYVGISVDSYPDDEDRLAFATAPSEVSMKGIAGGVPGGSIGLALQFGNEMEKKSMAAANKKAPKST